MRLGTVLDSMQKIYLAAEEVVHYKQSNSTPTCFDTGSFLFHFILIFKAPKDLQAYLSHTKIYGWLPKLPQAVSTIEEDDNQTTVVRWCFSFLASGSRVFIAFDSRHHFSLLVRLQVSRFFCHLGILHTSCEF